MSYKTLDMNQYERKSHFEYFQSMSNPYAGVTVNVDITVFLDRVRSQKYPFFLSFLYEAANAANSVKEFRQRIAAGSIVEYDTCHTSHTVMKENGTYSYCVLDCSLPFDRFLPYAADRQRQAEEQGTIEEKDNLSLIFVSSLPWLHYASLFQPTPFPPDSNPRITWGKFIEDGGRVILPVTVLVNHALVDGLKISEFYEHLCGRLLR